MENLVLPPLPSWVYRILNVFPARESTGGPLCRSHRPRRICEKHLLLTVRKVPCGSARPCQTVSRGKLLPYQPRPREGRLPLLPCFRGQLGLELSSLSFFPSEALLFQELSALTCGIHRAEDIRLRCGVRTFPFRGLRTRFPFRL